MNAKDDDATIFRQRVNNKPNSVTCVRDGQGPPVGDLPLVVVSRGSRDPTTGSPTQPEWLAAQERLAALSTRSINVVADAFYQNTSA